MLIKSPVRKTLSLLQFAALFLLLVSNYSNAQIKICEDRLWNRVCYDLHTDSSFIYTYSNCTGSVIGKGHYTQTKKNITFHFEDVVSPRVQKSYNPNKPKEVSITSLYTGDETHIMWLNNPIEYEGQKIWLGDGSSTFEYSDQPIVIRHPHYPFPKDSIVLTPQTEPYNEYKIFWHLSGDSFVEKGKVVSMKKVGKKYIHLEKMDEGNEEPDYREAIYFRRKQTK